MLPQGGKEIKAMKARDALWVGLFQGLAVLPGISRSGLTITGALWRGLNRETAVRYSFMLATPAIFGATLLEAHDMLANGVESALLMTYLLGGLIAFLSGILAIRFFIRLLQMHKFHYFAYYTWSVGILAILTSLLKA